MRSLPTRTAQHKKGRRFTPVAFAILAAALFVVFAGNTKAALRAPSDDLITGSLPASTTQNENLYQTTKGKEGIEAAARLKFDGGFINRPINWRIYKRDAETGQIGTAVFSGKSAIADTLLPPGNYRIEARYGLATARRDVSILPQTRLQVTFNLNVGAIRSLSRVAGIDVSHFSGATHSIYKISENGARKKIIDNIAQGQMVRLPAGQYEIESRFDKGNTVAVATVTVKPGILTSLNIDHQAALAELAFSPANKKPVHWVIFSHKGGWKKTGTSPKTRLILAPGLYTVTARINGKKQVRTVSLPKGKATTIIMGN